jgi:hypothetical protein
MPRLTVGEESEERSVAVRVVISVRQLSEKLLLAAAM